MDNRHFTNYSIDATDIWEYECDCYHEGKRDKKQIKELYEFLQNTYLLAGHEPFIEREDESAYANGYRERYDKRTEDEVTWNFFVCGGKVYDMNSPCEILLTDYNHLEFQRLFILKLRQYDDGLIYTEAFLKHQLKINFKNNLASFRKFLNVSMLQYPAAIDDNIIKIIDEWFIESEKKKSEKAAKPKSKRSKRESFVDQERPDTEATNLSLEDDTAKRTDGSNLSAAQNYTDVADDKNENQEEVKAENKSEESAQTKQEDEKPSDGKEESNSESLLVELETEETIPIGYRIVEGNFTKEEVQQYFSFLYKEKSNDGKPFLRENEVKEIFKYGLAIPLKPPAKKYKLNCSLTFPKNIVEFHIYKFYSKHTTSKHKQDVLKFFAYYITDFEKALLSEKDMQTWSGNVVGKRSRKIKFAIADYLPERFR